MPSLARVLHSVGRLLVTSGVVVLLFVAYQVWGTNLHTDRVQGELDREFQERLGEVDDPVVASSSSSTTTASTAPPDGTTTAATTPVSTVPAIPPPAEGEVVAQISIPKIGVTDFSVVQGVSVEQLKRGAGHYPTTPLPGQAGNASIAGHRTTYGAPFHNVDDLVTGDQITVRTLQGTFTYAVTAVTIVQPDDVSVLGDFGDNRLTLTACHPKFSARERIIVAAELVGNPVPKLEGQDEAAAKVVDSESEQVVGETAIDAFEEEPIVRFPGAWWALAALAAWAVTRGAAWILYRRRSPLWLRAIPYAIGLPVTLVLLYLFFGNFSFESLMHSLGISVG